ncbi:MAG TPA: His/Gly/Thr/Pro-type tRNA ligase C-terminal domain-containing protein, partial [Acidimicrobiia bacterium]|nr:His/Gly/Thr/Pro-type tRNA ligase C-terminal domain-containing protein [Acidimicrobiia bacterium]
RQIYRELKRDWNVFFDDAGNIGRRYRRQDEIGTPFCVTVDFETLEDRAVTIRERDTLEQVRVPIDSLVDEFRGRLAV